MIPSSKLIRLYTGMVKSRMLAERAGGGEACLRLEAVNAGVAEELVAGDSLEASPALMAAPVLVGAPPESFFTAARSGNGRLPPAALRLDEACSRAAEHLARGDGRIAVALLAEEDLDPDAWSRRLELAGRERLPIVFVRCYPVARAARHEFPPNGSRSGALVSEVPLIRVDGGDVIAVHRVASESVLRARERRGPSLMDAVADAATTFPHANGGRPPSDPIARMESHLLQRGLFRPALRRRIEDLFGRQLDRAAGVPRTTAVPRGPSR